MKKSQMPAARSRSPEPRQPSYEVGYGRPPVATRFRSGQSGNPRGRPKSSSKVPDLIEDLLKQTVTVSENGERRSLSRLEAVIGSLYAKAIKGDLRAANSILRLNAQSDALDIGIRTASSREESMPPPSAEKLAMAFLVLIHNLVGTGSDSNGSSCT